MGDDSYSGEIWDDLLKSKLDVEGLLLMHMNRIAIYRDVDIKKYCSSIETFILMCPHNIREKCLERINEMGLRRGYYSTITEDKLVSYDDLYIFINEQLEKHRMIWKKKSVKTFE